MKNNYFLNVANFRRKFYSTIAFFLLLISIGHAQYITGNNPYCIASNPTYTIVNPPAAGTYNNIVWTASPNSGITFAGNPSPTALTKVVMKSGNIISSPHYIYASFFLDGVLVAVTPNFNFQTVTPPVTPSYSVTKTTDYCTTQYHIINLTVTTNPNPSPNTSFSISPTVADPSVIVTPITNRVFELKLPLNGQNYFIYNITSTTGSSGCASNSVTTTSYGNAVSLNLTNCANNSVSTNYDFSVAPNPYSNGYLTIVAPVITSFGNPSVCRIYNTSGTLSTTFPLSTSSTSTSYALRSAVGASLVSGVYVVQVMYADGNTRSKNLIVN
ncbi:T9SS type A sorting domain-containing protein [Flavobacterium procerum]|uniref:T9SS type A sorting domain-containing protein n=1 Tax=Flavobacterium procerum TaxID=1455569 RepID=A0ABV6C127_9FLAO